MEKRVSRLMIWFLAAVFCLTLLSWVPLPGAYAGTAEVHFDEMDPLEDLESAEGFDVRK